MGLWHELDDDIAEELETISQITGKDYNQLIRRILADWIREYADELDTN
jgi:TorA maturation chaperone TorD